MYDSITQQAKRLYWLARDRNSPRRLAIHLRRRAMILAAYAWRRLLVNTTFIAITGSVGKTTTKEILSAVLAHRHSVTCTPGNANLRRFRGLEATILGTRPWHRYAVIELGTEKPGDMASAARFLKPDIAIVLDVKHCHTNRFKSLEAIAQEKSHLVRHLHRNGCAVLNQDNPLVASMPVPEGVRVLRFGASEGADLRLLQAESHWPRRLELSLSIQGNRHEVKSRLVGTHWTNAILATLAAAVHCGVPVLEAAGVIRTIDPFWARMQPITLANHATILRDDWNGSIDTFEAALQFLDDAQAARKIVVFSDFSDSKKKLRSRANHLGRIAASHADLALFVGDYADRSEQSAIEAGMAGNRAHAFFSLEDATAFLRQTLRAGDLVLLKGQANHHLSRIYLGLLGNVTCTQMSCPRQILCDRCPDLGFDWTEDMRAYRAAPGSFV